MGWKFTRYAELLLYFDTGEDLGYSLQNVKAGKPIVSKDKRTGHWIVRLPIESPGRGGIYLYNMSGRRFHCDAYIRPAGPSAAYAKLPSFEPSCAKYETLVGSPGCAANAITVASYDFNDQWSLKVDGKTRRVSLSAGILPIMAGALSDYSSPGPLRTARGTIKPDIAAPGQIFAAPDAKLRTGSSAGHSAGKRCEDSAADDRHQENRSPKSGRPPLFKVKRLMLAMHGSMWSPFSRSVTMQRLDKTGWMVCLIGLAVQAVAGRVDAASPTKVIRWEKNLETAYAKGIKESKPIMVVYVAPLDDPTCAHSQRFRAQVFSETFAALAGEAVFVMVEVPLDRAAWDKKDLALKLLDKLGRKAVPAITVLAPRLDKIVELGGTAGYFDAGALVKHLRPVIARHSSPTQTASTVK